jgi:hypothetical protein
LIIWKGIGEVIQWTLGSSREFPVVELRKAKLMCSIRDNKEDIMPPQPEAAHYKDRHKYQSMEAHF